MWAAGAVCFFAAWGRAGSEEAGAAFSLNLIAGLIVVMIICDFVIVNPVIRMASGRRVIGEKKGWVLFLGSLLHIIKVTALILLVMEIYYLINVGIIFNSGLDEKAVPVPLEPILFGILYGLLCMVLDIVWDKITGTVLTWRGKNA
jgi:hypothetical protein